MMSRKAPLLHLIFLPAFHFGKIAGAMRIMTLIMLLILSSSMISHHDACTLQSSRLTPSFSLSHNFKTYSANSVNPISEIVEARRIIAIGDIHGDLNALNTCLHLAGTIDREGNWIGEDTVVVQMGDLIDRGYDDLEVIERFLQLDEQASLEGGKVITLLGNHEIMNAQGDFGCTEEESFIAFKQLEPELEEILRSFHGDSSISEHHRFRQAAMGPGGLIANIMGSFPVVCKVGRTLFAHGAVSPQLLMRYSLKQLNGMSSDWLRGHLKEPPPFLEMKSRHSPIWSRKFSKPESQVLGEGACEELRLALTLAGCDRLVVGHTPQRRGINAADEGRVWRVDVGLSKYYGGLPEVLEIIGSQVTILTKSARIPEERRYCKSVETSTGTVSCEAITGSRIMI